MLVSIIICTRNRARHLEQTLASLARVCVPQTLPVEIIVVDNASTDDTAQVIKSFHTDHVSARYLLEPCGGIGYARNAAIAACRGEVLVFTDDDVRFPPDWIKGMCAPILAGRAQALQGGVRLAPDLERSWMEPYHRELLASTELWNSDHPTSLVGANMALSRCVFDRIPGFDTELGAGQLGFEEDSLFGRQVIQAGLTIVTALDCTVVHHPDPTRLSRSSFLDRARRQGRSSAYVAYHWEHRDIPSPAAIRCQIAQKRVLLALLRLSRLSQVRRREGIAVWESVRACDISRLEGYLEERRRPRKYALKGLQKLSSV